MLETAKSVAEKATGIARPRRADVIGLVSERKANTFRLKDDGETPNNPNFPLVLYRGAVTRPEQYDPAAIFEALFESNGWGDGWRDSMYDWLHWHTGTHEVLGVARGWLRAQFGGKRGRTIRVKAGDVLVLPAGTGHRCLGASKDILIVGAYPPNSRYDERTPDDDTHDKDVRAIAKVKPPKRDPVYGPRGPLLDVWT